MTPEQDFAEALRRHVQSGRSAATEPAVAAARDRLVAWHQQNKRARRSAWPPRPIGVELNGAGLVVERRTPNGAAARRLDDPTSRRGVRAALAPAPAARAGVLR